ncbi:hypothetical protein [Streptomyces griseosporeus]|uniref:hypothetical protein n=1 Tax=Streptomyces griseosporeus TaxID=1910 RepID=UPI00369B61BA
MSEMESSTTPEATPAEGDTPSEGNPANREAAKYRRQLRETEAKLSAAEERVNRLLRKAIEDQVSSKLAVPADLFDVGKVELSDLLDADGYPDSETIDAAADALLKQRPHLSARPMPWPSVHGGTEDEDDEEAPTRTWTEALRYNDPRYSGQRR